MISHFFHSFTLEYALKVVKEFIERKNSLGVTS